MMVYAVLLSINQCLREYLDKRRRYRAIDRYRSYRDALEAYGVLYQLGIISWRNYEHIQSALRRKYNVEQGAES